MGIASYTGRAEERYLAAGPYRGCYPVERLDTVSRRVHLTGTNVTADLPGTGAGSYA